MGDQRLFFMWKEYENVTEQQTKDTRGRYGVHIKEGNFQPFEEWVKSEEDLENKKINKCAADSYYPSRVKAILY